MDAQDFLGLDYEKEVRKHYFYCRISMMKLLGKIKTGLIGVLELIVSHTANILVFLW